MPKDGRSGGRLSSIFSSSQTNLKAPQPTSKAIPPISTTLSPNVQPGKLTKPPTINGHARSASGQSQSPATLLPPAQFPPSPVLRKPVPRVDTDNLLSPAQLPPAAGGHGRSTTTPVAAPPSLGGSRPTTPISHHSGSSIAPTPSPQTLHKKRSSWLPGGGSSRPASRQNGNAPKAWILGHANQAPYDLGVLVGAHRVSLGDGLLP